MSYKIISILLLSNTVFSQTIGPTKPIINFHELEKIKYTLYYESYYKLNDTSFKDGLDPLNSVVFSTAINPVTGNYINTYKTSMINTTSIYKIVFKLVKGKYNEY
jgi:hypothetical protein